jgi:uncharacterized membrane protein YedE/YeeE
VALLVAAVVLGFIMGFAAHRASICTVRAVAEVISARSAYMFASVGRSWLWVWAVMFSAIWLSPAAAVGNGWALTAQALFGGLLFGFGAALNGGCAYSTMTRFVDGEGAMLVAITGFAAGSVLFATLLEARWLSRPSNAPLMLQLVTSWSLLLAAGFIGWAIYEAVRLWRSREPSASLRELLLAPRWRLSSAAMVMGVTGAALLLLFGPFGYTATFEVLIERVFGTAATAPSTARWAVLIALLAGMLTSTLLRGSFRLDLRPRRAWLLNFAGGALMGFGTALAPGGNDALVMYGVPTLSPYALPTYIALAAGVAAALLLLRAAAGFEAKAEFRNDVFIADSWSRPPPAEARSATPRG